MSGAKQGGVVIRPPAATAGSTNVAPICQNIKGVAMDKRISNLLKQKIKQIPDDCGVPRREMMVAVYMIFVQKYGKEAVGILEQYVNRSPGYWTLERCMESAKPHLSRLVWQKACKPAYNRASKNGWLDECCAHMEDFRKRPGYWDLEKCKADAKKYKTRSEWRKSTSAYTVACLKGWIDECCTHMGTKEFKPYRFWNKETCLEDAKKHSTRNAWRTAGGSGYPAAHKYGWVDECCAHMTTRRSMPIGHWTLEACIGEAKKFQTRTSWQKSSKGSYLAAFRNGWFEECCAHMPKRASKK